MAGGRHSAVATSGSGPGRRARGPIESESERRRSRLRVLLAEDDDDMRRHLASALRAEGFQVRPVRSGVELLKSFGALLLRGRLATSVDLVISDLRMPGITGLKVLDWLRRANWRVPFILITAFGDESVHAEARRLGATSLDKPFDVRELIAQARSVAARGQ